MYCEAKAGAVRADWRAASSIRQINPSDRGARPCTIPVAELRQAYTRATEAPRSPRVVDTGRRQGCGRGAGNVPVDQLYAMVDASSDPDRSLGSNNWVIAGSRTYHGPSHPRQ